VLGVVLVSALAWTFAVPPLQGADESAHFSYVQKIADAHDVPWRHSEYGLLEAAFPPAVSTELRTAWTWAGLEPLRGNLAARPLWTQEDERIWAAEDARLRPADRRDGIGSNVFLNPPLYYLTATVPYEMAGGTFFDRLANVVGRRAAGSRRGQKDARASILNPEIVDKADIDDVVAKLGIDHRPERIGEALNEVIAHCAPSFPLRPIVVRKPSGSLSLA